MNISSRITQILEEKAITKTEFANLLGVERKTVYNILAKKDMGIQVLEKISKVLDIPLGKLIGIDMDDPKCEFVEVPMLETGAKASFLESYSDLNKSMGIYPVHKEVIASTAMWTTCQRTAQRPVANANGMCAKSLHQLIFSASDIELNRRDLIFYLPGFQKISLLCEGFSTPANNNKTKRLL